MLEKTKLVLERSEATLKTVTADSWYSDGKLGNAVDETVIPYLRALGLNDRQECCSAR